MFAYWKGTIPPGQVFHQVVTTLDLTATVAHAAGMAVLPEKDFDGVSLLNSLRTKTQPASFTSQQHWFGLLGDAAVQKDGMKLRRSRNTFLFNVTHDPYELFNLAGSHQGNSPQMLATLVSAVSLEPLGAVGFSLDPWLTRPLPWTELGAGQVAAHAAVREAVRHWLPGRGHEQRAAQEPAVHGQRDRLPVPSEGGQLRRQRDVLASGDYG